MSASHGIDGLIKWAQREEWRDDLVDALARHAGRACRDMDIEFADIEAIIGGELMGMLWGCIFEDMFASRKGERNVADDYLKRRGWKESAGTRAYIQALRNSTMSLYEVSDIVVGESFLARDLLRGGEPVRVQERTATRSMKPWDRVAARIVTVLGKTQMTGAVLAYSPDLAQDMVAQFEKARKRALRKAATRAPKPDGGPRIAGERSRAVTDALLTDVAAMLSDVWLVDVLDRMLDPTLPTLQNTDGDPLEFITVHFPLAPDASRPAIVAALNGLPALETENDAFWKWLADAKPAREPARPKPGEATTPGSTMDSGVTILGNIEITAKAVTLSVNSEARAESGRALLEPALAGLVRPPLVERQTIEQMLASARDRPAPKRVSGLSPEQEREAVQQFLADHYRRTLDEPLPVLGDRSPRKAVKTAKGRDEVIAWLKTLENRSGRYAPGDPMAGFDFDWMWKELGLEDARR